MISRKLFINSVLVILFVSAVFVYADNALAHGRNEGLWRPGQPIVPCGGNTAICINNVCDNGAGPCTNSSECGQQAKCGPCDILHLIKHIIDFILVAAAPVLATLFFIIAGVYIMLGGANPGMLSTGKRMFNNTFIGLIIVMMSWLITNTVIKTLVDPAHIDGTWYEFDCQAD